MITKQMIADVAAKYKTSRTGLAKLFKSTSGHMRYLQLYLKECPEGELSVNALIQLQSILNEFPKEYSQSNTGKIFCEIRRLISPSPLHTTIDLTKQAWQSSSPYRRATTVANSFSEITNIQLSPMTRQISESSIAALFLALNFYGATQTRLSYLLTGKMTQAAITIASDLLRLPSFTASIQLQPYIPSNEWIIAMTIQLGFDYYTEQPTWLFTTSYLLGSLIEQLGLKFSQTLLETQPGRKVVTRYPHTVSLGQMFVCDLSYLLGACLILCISNLIKSEQRTSDKKQENKSSNDESEKNNYTKTFRPVRLTEQEQMLITNSRECHTNLLACESAAYKALGFFSTKNISWSEIKNRSNALFLWFHPDKCQIKPEECAQQTIQINSAKSVLRSSHGKK